VGMLAEKKPDKFGFSDTTFRIFVLMNSRRMKSDRFYTTDYTAAVYTQAGIDWVANNDLRSVLLRHYPSLAPALQGVPNVFGPWRDVRR
jgi:heme peroxidase